MSQSTPKAVPHVGQIWEEKRVVGGCFQRKIRLTAILATIEGARYVPHNYTRRTQSRESVLSFRTLRRDYRLISDAGAG